jgi:hypothetical protein
MATAGERGVGHGRDFFNGGWGRDPTGHEPFGCGNATQTSWR